MWSQLNTSDFLSISTGRAQIERYTSLLCLYSVITKDVHNPISGKRQISPEFKIWYWLATAKIYWL